MEASICTVHVCFKGKQRQINSFLPLNLTVSEDGVEHWLRHRTIPKNRAYVDALLSKVGLSLTVFFVDLYKMEASICTVHVCFKGKQRQIKMPDGVAHNMRK